MVLGGKKKKKNLSQSETVYTVLMPNGTEDSESSRPICVRE